MTTREEWFKHLYILTDEDDLAAGRRHKVYIEGTSPNLKRQIRAETIAEITNILDLWLHECTIKLQQLQKEDKNHKGHQSDSYRKGHEAAYDSLHKELAAWIIELKLHIRSLQSPPLSDQEKKDIAKSVKEIKEGKCKVIPSNVDNATYLTLFDEKDINVLQIDAYILEEDSFKNESQRIIIKRIVGRGGIIRWAILKGDLAFSKSSKHFELSPMPSSRTDGWIADHRFSTAQSAFDFWNANKKV